MGHIVKLRVKNSHRRPLTIRILWFIGGVYFLQSFKFSCIVQWATLSQVPDYIGTNYPFVRQMVKIHYQRHYPVRYKYSPIC